MGMFDYVAFEGKCPQCGADLEGWQTKDMPDPGMETVTPEMVRNFYTSCNKCNAWVEANVLPPKEMRIVLISFKNWRRSAGEESGRKVYTVKTVTQEIEEVE